MRSFDCFAFEQTPLIPDDGSIQDNPARTPLLYALFRVAQPKLCAQLPTLYRITFYVRTTSPSLLSYRLGEDLSATGNRIEEYGTSGS